ncbi:hypothetical protein L195_g019222, partial [Trifolium pratense]
ENSTQGTSPYCLIHVNGRERLKTTGKSSPAAELEMSLVDYASSSDDEDVPEPTEESPKEKEKPQRHSPQPQPQPQPPSQTL